LAQAGQSGRGAERAGNGARLQSREQGLDAVREAVSESEVDSSWEAGHTGKGTACKVVAIRGNADRYRVAFEFANHGLGMVDLKGRFLDANARLCEILRLDREQLLEMKVQELAVPTGETPVRERLKEALDSHASSACFEMRYVSPKGENLWLDVCWGMGRNRHGRPLYFVVSVGEITAQKRAQGKLEEQASTDALTKTLLRSRFEERCRHELLRSSRYGYKLSLVMADLDHFKNVNDQYGHSVGDLVLIGFCEVMRRVLRVTDVLGRWGGEEFVILLPDTGPRGAKRVCDRVRAAVESHAFPQGIRVTVSLGVAGRRVAEGFASFLARADAAMYSAKRGGRNRVVVDSEDLLRDSAGKPDVPNFVELHWKRGYASGQPGIDAEHRQLFRQVNHILAAMVPSSDPVVILPMVRDLLTEIGTHFGHEEKLMEEIKYPEIVEHKQCHQRLLGQALELSERLKRKEATAAELVGFVIHDVVAKHILLEDRKYFPYIGQTEWSEKVEKHRPPRVRRKTSRELGTE